MAQFPKDYELLEANCSKEMKESFKVKFYFPNMCHICHTIESDSLKLIRCGGCNMISYCGKSHQNEHYGSHRDLCVEINNLLEITKTNNLFDCLRRMEDPAQRLRKKRSLIEMMQKKLGRDLLEYEKMMFLYPRVCFFCTESNPTLLENCQSCPQASFCKKHKNQAGHAEFCYDMKICYSMYWCENFSNKTNTSRIICEENIPFLNELSKPPENMDKLLKTFKDHIPKFWTALREVDLWTAFLSELCTEPLTLVHALRKLDLEIQSELIVHIIGIPRTKEFNFSTMEILLHLIPQLMSLKVIVISENLTNEERNLLCRICRLCEAKKKTYILEGIKSPYSSYVNSKGFITPNIVISYDYGSNDFRLWDESILKMKKIQAPLVITKNSKLRAYKEQTRMNNLLGLLTSKVLFEENPFASYSPRRDLNDDVINFSNNYLAVYTLFETEEKKQPKKKKRRGQSEEEFPDFVLEEERQARLQKYLAKKNEAAQKASHSTDESESLGNSQNSLNSAENSQKSTENNLNEQEEDKEKSKKKKKKKKKKKNNNNNNDKAEKDGFEDSNCGIAKEETSDVTKKEEGPKLKKKKSKSKGSTDTKNEITEEVPTKQSDKKALESTFAVTTVGMENDETKDNSVNEKNKTAGKKRKSKGKKTTNGTSQEDKKMEKQLSDPASKPGFVLVRRVEEKPENDSKQKENSAAKPKMQILKPMNDPSLEEPEKKMLPAKEQIKVGKNKGKSKGTGQEDKKMEKQLSDPASKPGFVLVRRVEEKPENDSKQRENFAAKPKMQIWKPMNDSSLEELENKMLPAKEQIKVGKNKGKSKKEKPSSSNQRVSEPAGLQEPYKQLLSKLDDLEVIPCINTQENEEENKKSERKKNRRTEAHKANHTNNSESEKILISVTPVNATSEEISRDLAALSLQEKETKQEDSSKLQEMLGATGLSRSRSNLENENKKLMECINALTNEFEEVKKNGQELAIDLLGEIKAMKECLGYIEESIERMTLDSL